MPVPVPAYDLVPVPVPVPVIFIGAGAGAGHLHRHLQAPVAVWSFDVCCSGRPVVGTKMITQHMYIVW